MESRDLVLQRTCGLEHRRTSLTHGLRRTRSFPQSHSAEISQSIGSDFISTIVACCDRRTTPHF